MKLKDLGQKIEEVTKEIQPIVSAINDNKSITEYIINKLKECMVDNDVVKAIAIVDYCIHNTDISSADLSILKTNNEIYQVSQNKGYDNFEIEFLGFCEALHYIE